MQQRKTTISRAESFKLSRNRPLRKHSTVQAARTYWLNLSDQKLLFHLSTDKLDIPDSTLINPLSWYHFKLFVNYFLRAMVTVINVFWNSFGYPTQRVYSGEPVRSRDLLFCSERFRATFVFDQHVTTMSHSSQNKIFIVWLSLGLSKRQDLTDNIYKSFVELKE